MNSKNKTILALGSNVSQEANMLKAKGMIERLLDGDVVFSEYMWTNPIGVDSDKFLNCLAIAHTDMDVAQFDMALKDIEHNLGSSKAEHQKGIVRIDIDVLLFGGQRYHEADWGRDYVKKMMAELMSK